MWGKKQGWKLTALPMAGLVPSGCPTFLIVDIDVHYLPGACCWFHPQLPGWALVCYSLPEASGCCTAGQQRKLSSQRSPCPSNKARKESERWFHSLQAFKTSYCSHKRWEGSPQRTCDVAVSSHLLCTEIMEHLHYSFMGTKKLWF